MTTISKILVVFTTVAAIAFLGAVMVSVAGGPNWRAEADDLGGYYVEQTEGENPQWVVKSHATDQQLRQGTAVLPQAIIGARTAIRDDQQTELAELDARIRQLQPQIEEAKQLTAVDLAAIEKREAELVAEIEDQRERIQGLSSEGIVKAQQAQEIRNEAARRREDVYRLENQLAEIRTDKFQAQEQAKRLEDQLQRVGGNLNRLQRRKAQLEQAADESATDGYDPAAPSDNDAPEQAGNS